MKKLAEMVDLLENNNLCVILKVKDNQFANLISLGCFLGNETMFRLTKGDDHTCTIWRDNGKSVSWSWGLHGYTLVSDTLSKCGKQISNTIIKDFKIDIE